MKSFIITNFSLEHTLDSGQFFLYEKIYEFYYVILKDKIFKVKQENDTLFYNGIEEQDLIHFFSLDVDLDKITEDFSEDYYLNLAKQKYFGLRLLRQDLFQTIMGFVLSSASNIPKIQNSLKLLCQEFGKRVEFDGMIFHTFPDVGSINDLEKIKQCKCGFRSKYIYQINQILSQNSFYLEKIENSNYEDAKKLLIALPGIGEKVANCILLFSIGHDTFPIDTWIKQVIEKLYLNKEAKNLREIEDFIDSYFGENRGIKQQYLFHYARNNEF